MQPLHRFLHTQRAARVAVCPVSMPGPWAPLPQPLAQTESARCRNVSSSSPASPAWSLLVHYTYTPRGLNSLRKYKHTQVSPVDVTQTYSPGVHSLFSSHWHLDLSTHIQHTHPAVPPVTGISTYKLCSPWSLQLLAHRLLYASSLHVLIPRPTSPKTCGLLWSLAHKCLFHAGLSSC